MRYILMFGAMIGGALFLLAASVDVVNDATDEQLYPFADRVTAVLFGPLIWTGSWVLGIVHAIERDCKYDENNKKVYKENIYI